MNAHCHRDPWSAARLSLGPMEDTHSDKAALLTFRLQADCFLRALSPSEIILIKAFCLAVGIRARIGERVFPHSLKTWFDVGLTKAVSRIWGQSGHGICRVEWFLVVLWSLYGWGGVTSLTLKEGQSAPSPCSSLPDCVFASVPFLVNSPKVDG